MISNTKTIYFLFFLKLENVYKEQSFIINMARGKITSKTPATKIVGSKRIFYEIRKGSSKRGKSLGVYTTKASSLKVAKRLSKKHDVTVFPVKILKAPMKKSITLMLNK